MKQTIVLVASVLVGCGLPHSMPDKHVQDGVGNASPQSPTYSTDPGFQHTPGFFRDLSRLVAAQSTVDDDTAVTRWLIELPQRMNRAAAQSNLPTAVRNTLHGLLYLSLRTMQSTSNQPLLARTAGETIISAALGLDPAFLAANNLALQTPWGAVAIASAALDGIGAVATQPSCALAQAQAVWTPEDPMTIWVPPSCEPGTIVQGFCGAGEWVNGTCVDRWICEDGRWDHGGGGYEWVCRGDDCGYEWVTTSVWVSQDCSRGHWESTCYGGYWEPGMCYDTVEIPAVCNDGYEEVIYTDGTWSFVQAPMPCTAERPAQIEIARSALFVLAEHFDNDLPSAWGLGLEELSLATDNFEAMGESHFAAALQILTATAQD